MNLLTGMTAADRMVTALSCILCSEKNSQLYFLRSAFNNTVKYIIDNFGTSHSMAYFGKI